MPLLKKVTWGEIRQQVRQVNIELFDVIEQLSISSGYNLYKACYPFGYESVRKGCFFLPNKENRPVPLSDNSIDSKVQEDLGYNLFSHPVSLILKNSFEIFLLMENHTIPLALIPQGKIISTWLVLEPHINFQPAFLWNVSAGARSIFMLPKISMAYKYKRLKLKFNLDRDMPIALLDHGEIFKELANSAELKESWSAEVLYFGKKWFQHLNDTDPCWIRFYNYLYKNTWSGSGFMRTEFFWNLVFSLIQRRKNLRPNPYLADSVKHLLAIGLGAYPGFAPAINNLAAPITELQKIFQDDYKLDNYAPIIMQPHYFSMNQGKTRPVYYSLQYPTTFNFSPTSQKTSNKIIDLLEVQYLLNKYFEEISSNSLNLQGTPFANITKDVKYDFFHSDPNSYKSIEHSIEIVKNDKSFGTNFKNFQNKQFPHKTPFFRGCVRIIHA